MKNGLKVYILADSHFGHAKMIELCGRPKGFEQLIIDSLKELPANCILIHLGDFCIGNDEKWHKSFMFVTAHCKRRILVLGNHDHKSCSWYLDQGWDFVCDELTVNWFGKKILFSHKPLLNTADINVHGHLHNTGHREKGPCNNHKLLAIENTNYKPVNLEKFIFNK